MSGREGHHHAKMTDDDIQDAQDQAFIRATTDPDDPAC